MKTYVPVNIYIFKFTSNMQYELYEFKTFNLNIFYNKAFSKPFIKVSKNI
jgi:hypothetical protein